MNFHQLYQQSIFKKHQQIILEQERANEIKQMSSSKKMNSQSSLILTSKLCDQLSHFRDDEILNIQSSIPILYATKILQVIESIESAKQKIQVGQYENSRLKEQARFIYCLWRMIDQEQIETRELKQLIYMFNEKQIPELKHQLREMYKNQDAVDQFLQTWRIISQNNQYYKAIQKQDKKSKENKQIQKIMVYDEFKEGQYNDTRELKELFINKESNIKPIKYKDNNFLTMESNEYFSKNKDSMHFDRSKEKILVDRLYQNDKYQMRLVQKKIDDQRKQRLELQKCTFKPEIIQDRLRSISNKKRSSSINGYSKAVNRMKVGQQKNRIQKEKRQYKPVGQNYEKLRSKNINPPKFLQRKKNEEVVQFVIEFDLGRHKVKVKVHETDKQQEIASNLCKIYCLKQEYFNQICMIVRKERQLQLQKRQEDQY